MGAYIVVLAGIGGVILLTAWLPMVLKDVPFTLPICCVAFGAVLFAAINVVGETPSPQNHLGLTERLTELVVIVALMGAGLKLDRPLRWASAALTWRLLILAMPLTIAAIALLASSLLGVGLAAALLLGAALAPTDPVLASDVQVGPPGEGMEDDVRFTLTSEAGLNDGLAFPFVNLAIALAIALPNGGSWLLEWVSVDVLWKLAIGLVAGATIGRVLGWVTFHLPHRARLSRTGDGFVALGITALAYSLTEMVHGYGFLAVFVAAVAFRASAPRHRYHEKLHDFVEQIERLLMMLLLVCFGGALSVGGLLQAVSWPVVAFAVVTLLLVRPAAAWLSLVGRPEPRAERAVIAFFGIRGIGSVYYLAYALDRASFDEASVMWSAVALVILFSIVLHGASVTPVMRFLDRRRGRRSPPAPH